ncbi:hypothetical protein SCRES1_gp85 [Synechococcus phage S-CRES1]|nr:hypothetical protein SCRES1_gp85 [Synechococcus phage S-CRES1]
MGLNAYWRKNPFYSGVAKSGTSSQTGGDAPLLPESKEAGGSLVTSSTGGIFGISKKKVDPAGAEKEGSSGGSFQGCFDSSSCAIGWRCIGNVCVPPSGTAGSGSSADNDYGCGGDGSDGGGGGGGGTCGPAAANVGSSGCTTTGCGGDGGPDDGGGPNGGCCSDVKCCRQGGCSCGDCPPSRDCIKFCDEYKAANGEKGPGCQEENSCDECEYCDEDESKCKSKGDSSPCYCDGSKACPDCEQCNKDGTCSFAPGNCLECCYVSVECSCGITLQGKCCYPYGSANQEYESGCQGKCRKAGQAECDKLCPPPPEPEPECTSDGECNDCEYCDSNNTCQTDPACEPKRYYGVALAFSYQRCSVARSGCDNDNPCVGSCTTIWTTPAYFIGDLDDPNDLGPEYIIKPAAVRGPFSIACQYYCSPCANGSSYIELLVYRSDGVTIARPLFTSGFMFDSQYFDRKQYYCSIRRYTPMEQPIPIYVTGDDSVEVSIKLSEAIVAIQRGSNPSFPDYPVVP